MRAPQAAHRLPFTTSSSSLLLALTFSFALSLFDAPFRQHIAILCTTRSSSLLLALTFPLSFRCPPSGSTSQWAVLRRAQVDPAAASLAVQPQQHLLAPTSTFTALPHSHPHHHLPTPGAHRVAWQQLGDDGIGGEGGGVGEGEEGAGMGGRMNEGRYEWSWPEAGGGQAGVEGFENLKARAYHTCTFAERQGCALVFGGFAQGRPLAHLEALDLVTWTWSAPLCAGHDPAPRFGHSATLSGNDLVVAGGCSGGHNHKGLATDGEEFDDIWVLKLGSGRGDVMTWTQLLLRELPSPPATARCHASFSAGHKIVFLFGGPSNALSNKFTMFDVRTKKFTTPELVLGRVPRPRQGALVKKLDDCTAVVFGGWAWKEMGDVHFVRLLGASLTYPGLPATDTGGASCPSGAETRGTPRSAVVLRWLLSNCGFRNIEAYDLSSLASLFCAGVLPAYRLLLVRVLLGIFSTVMVGCLVAWCWRIWNWAG